MSLHISLLTFNLKWSIFWIILLYLVPHHLSLFWWVFMICCVNKTMPIYFIIGKYHIKQMKVGKAVKTCLSNHTWSVSHHIMLLVINALRGGHTDRQTHIYQCTTKAISRNRACVGHRPVLVWFKNFDDLPIIY